MPRTKRPVNRAGKKSTAEDDEAFKKLARLVNDQKNKIDLRAQMQCRDIELAFKILLGSISTNVLQKTVGELKTELILKEVPIASRSQKSSASHDDGYLTENSSHDSGDGKRRKMLPPTTSGRSTGRRSRSADASARKLPGTVNKPGPRSRSRSVYRTPAYNKNAVLNYPAITPKVTPHTPLTVLRQPRQGEMVVSMSGSPVMVPTYNNMQPDEKANCNIMLQDGTMLSLQPKQLRQSSAFIPFTLMDSNVLMQLKTLKDNLDTVVKMGEKAFK